MISEKIDLQKEKPSNYKKAYKIAEKVGTILQDETTADISQILKDGRVDEKEADFILKKYMKEAHVLIAEFSKRTQEVINEKHGISLPSFLVDFEENRAEGMATAVASDEFSKKQKELNEALLTFSKSVVDKTIKKNSDHLYKNGVEAKIIRATNGKCCKWCSALAGTYKYPDTPRDVYRRHLYCDCTVEYYPDKTKKQNVHTKEWIEDDKSDIIEKRKSLSQENPSEISDIRKQCLKYDIQYNQIKKHKGIKTEKDIIKKLGGLDKTVKGSCSSLALAYIGNKAGYDVLDYRGGKSRDIFANGGTVKNIAELSGVKSFIEYDYNDFKAVSRLIQNMAEGKEYYLATGKHAAIIRKTSKGLEYLELQDYEHLNGYKKLNDKVLKKRFKCQKTHKIKYIGKVEARSFLIDTDSLKNNEEFKKILGFINTNGEKQLKGDGGSVK